MGRSPDDRVTQEVAREICQRTGSKAMLAGSISNLGSHYAIGLEATNCATGDSLAREEVESDSKEKVLSALGGVTSSMRAKLGESLSSLQKFDAPIEQVTTPSLEALKAYSLGQSRRDLGVEREAIPFLKRAIELDPNFAHAYATLGTLYSNFGETELASENLTKAYDLRERTSEREKFYITAHYNDFVTGDADKVLQTYQLWSRTYPRDSIPHVNLSVLYQNMGQFEKSIPEDQEAIRLEPTSGFGYWNLQFSYLALGRLDEANSIFNQELAHGIDGFPVRFARYLTAFVQRDTATMAQQVAWAAGKSEESIMLPAQAATQAFFGRAQNAREMMDRAAEMVQREGYSEIAATDHATEALTAADLGDLALARKEAAAAMALSRGWQPRALVAVALARTGEKTQAGKIADDLSKEFPSATFLNAVSLPTVRAALEISEGRPERAVELLKTAAPYELGSSGPMPPLYSIYVRGGAYLRARQGSEAAAEFQKILDHPGVVTNSPNAALAHLGLARAYGLQGDATKARTAYQDFFALWKDADPDVPILQEAKAEYAKLR